MNGNATESGCQNIHAIHTKVEIQTNSRILDITRLLKIEKRCTRSFVLY